MAQNRKHIHVHATPDRFPITGKHRIVRGDGCINCGKCIELCVYGVHYRDLDDVRRMAKPDFDKCMNCFACVQDCTARVLSMDLNPAFTELGDALYPPEQITSIMRQAATGTIPVFGAGYGGAFAGSGFDGMWTDMSEIVRPTRDGIHGRETISTTIDLGRHPVDLSDVRFDDEGYPLTRVPATIEIRLPVLLNRMPFAPATTAVGDAVCRAAETIGTLAIVDTSTRLDWGAGPRRSVVVHVDRDHLDRASLTAVAQQAAGVQLAAGEETLPALLALQEEQPHAFVFAEVEVAPGFEDTIEQLAAAGADVLHLTAPPYASGLDPVDRGLPEAIAAAHGRLVEAAIRDQTTLIASGGITSAEHVAKAIILGADAVAVDLPALIALECTLCKDCARGEVCPRDLETIDPEWGARRIVNLLASWRNQLLEVLGAMGLRDVARLRGETGRAIFRDDLERTIFEPIFGGEAGASRSSATAHISATHVPLQNGEAA